MSHSFVDAQIRAHIYQILAVDLTTEAGHQQALERAKRLRDSFTEPGLSRALRSSAGGRLVLELIGQCGQ